MPKEAATSNPCKLLSQSKIPTRYHALLLAVCGAHLAIVLTSARELWPLLVVQSWQLGGFAIYALGILPFTVLIVAAPLLRDRVQQKRSAVESILPGDARLPA